jgi:hypothetical protein
VSPPNSKTQLNSIRQACRLLIKRDKTCMRVSRAVVNLTRCEEKVVRIIGVIIRCVREELIRLLAYCTWSISKCLVRSCLAVPGVCWSMPGYTDSGNLPRQTNQRGKRGRSDHASRIAHARPTRSLRSAGLRVRRGRFVGCTCDDMMARAPLSFPFPANGRGRIECRGGGDCTSSASVDVPVLYLLLSVSISCPCLCLCS